MTEDRLKMLIDSYGLVYILQALDLEPQAILMMLIEDGTVDLEKLEKEFE